MLATSPPPFSPIARARYLPPETSSKRLVHSISTVFCSGFIFNSYLCPHKKRRKAASPGEKEAYVLSRLAGSLSEPETSESVNE